MDPSNPLRAGPPDGLSGRDRARRIIPLLASLAVALPAWPAWAQPTESSSRVHGALAELQARAERAINGLFAGAAPRPASITILAPGAAFPGVPDAAPGHTPMDRAGALPERMVLLVHGLDEPGTIWNDLAPALMDAGHAVARADYPNDQPIADSAGDLASLLRAARSKGCRHVDVVAHSMGGLVMRDVLTAPSAYAGRAGGHDDLPDIGRLILIGTPNTGSPWARLRAVSELREQLLRLNNENAADASSVLSFLSDGLGEAGEDLLPGSAYLAELASRPAPTGVELTVIAGRVAAVESEDLAWLTESSMLRLLVGADEADRLTASIRELSSTLGDGVVSVESATSLGAADTVLLEATHRGLIERVETELAVRRAVQGSAPETPPAIPIILDRLRRDPPADPRPDPAPPAVEPPEPPAPM